MMPGREEEDDVSGKVWVYATIMVLLWGSHAAVATLTMSHAGAGGLSTWGFLFFNLLFGEAGLMVMIAATGRLRLYRMYSAKRVARLVLVGVFGAFLYYFLLFSAFRLAAPPVDAVAEANIINYLFPICTMLASAVVLRERLSPRGIVSAVISFGGAFLVISRGRFETITLQHPQIDLLALGAAISWGMFSALGRRWRHEPLTGMSIFLATGILISACLLPWAGGRILPRGWEIYGCFHVGFLCNTLAVILWFAALRVAGATVVGNFALIGAFVSLVFIRLLLGEAIGPWAVAGLAIIAFGVILSRRRVRAAPASDAPPVRAHDAD